ncbi:hypothetical protein E1301_Tti023632 [Triplophysa tibetana]|uniref:Uncharacterized protein n=1 Tax=Triplophysa tibetana TaxID=1572043 RepID=A0A5A9PHQ6_9TELE|nr:hypothetical protein E1301_Tti023632 [Triplophysa tibetana]
MLLNSSSVLRSLPRHQANRKGAERPDNRRKRSTERERERLSDWTREIKVGAIADWNSNWTIDQRLKNLTSEEEFEGHIFKEEEKGDGEENWVSRKKVEVLCNPVFPRPLPLPMGDKREYGEGNEENQAAWYNHPKDQCETEASAAGHSGVYLGPLCQNLLLLPLLAIQHLLMYPQRHQKEELRGRLESTAPSQQC